MYKSEYRISWNPDNRWLARHWKMSHYSSGCWSSSLYNYLSDALAHPLKMVESYPESITIVSQPAAEQKEIIRKYYGRILEVMINEDDGKYIGC